MNEEDIKLLLTLQRTRNITKTTEIMNLTQPALTRRIQVLEADLGVRLLIRSRNGVIFTPEGENILPKIKELGDGFTYIREYLNVHAGKICGRLKLGASSNYAQFGMAKVVADFAGMYPDVKFHIESAQSWHVYKRLLNKDISLAILRGAYKWDDINIMFSQEPIYLIAKEPCSRKDLNSMQYIQRNMESSLKKTVSQWFCENEIHPKSQIDIDNIKFAISLVEEGAGWAIVPGACLENFSGYKTPLVFRDKSSLTRNSYLLCSKEYIRQPQVWLFCKAVLESGNVPGAAEKLPAPENLQPDFHQIK